MLVYKHSFEKEANNRKIALVLNITLIDNLIIFETLAIVNEFLKGGYKCFLIKNMRHCVIASPLLTMRCLRKPKCRHLHYQIGKRGVTLRNLTKLRK